MSAFLVASLLGGCLGSDDGDDGPSEHELLARVSAGIEVKTVGDPIDEVVYVDLAAAREQGRLPEDADAQAVRGGRDAAAKLPRLAGRVLVYASRPEPTPLSEAIDGRRISAAAAQPIQGEPTVLVIATDQPFEEIAAKLRSRGYSERSGLLVRPGSFAPVVYTVAAHGGDGIVVLGVDEDVVRAAVKGAGNELTAAAHLVTEVAGVARMAVSGRSDCVRGIAAGEELTPARGEYLVLLDGKADPTRARAAQADLRDRGLNVERPRVEGDHVRARLTVDDEGLFVNNPFFMELTGGEDPLYECP